MINYTGFFLLLFITATLEKVRKHTRDTRVFMRLGKAREHLSAQQKIAKILRFHSDNIARTHLRTILLKRVFFCR